MKEVIDFLESLKPKIKKTKNKHGTEYAFKFANSASYEFSFSKSAPGNEFLENIIDPFVSKEKKDGPKA